MVLLPESLQALKKVAKEAGLDLSGAYLNLDGGFDSAHNRKCIFNAGLIPNIPENPRNRKRPKRGRKRLFNPAIHALRMRVERTFAWEDKFKRLLLRFERIRTISPNTVSTSVISFVLAATACCVSVSPTRWVKTDNRCVSGAPCFLEP